MVKIPTKLNRVLDNQKALFAFMSKLMGDVAQNSKNLAELSSNVAQIARIQGSGIGYSAVRGQGGTPDLSLVLGGRFLFG